MPIPVAFAKITKLVYTKTHCWSDTLEKLKIKRLEVDDEIIETDKPHRTTTACPNVKKTR